MLLKKLTKMGCSKWFLKPVDPIANGCPSYYDIIKKPMDLGTISSKLRERQYATPLEFKVHMGGAWAHGCWVRHDIRQRLDELAANGCRITLQGIHVGAGYILRGRAFKNGEAILNVGQIVSTEHT